MADHSHIEWTDATWNPITGCSVVSPGCTNCYAMKLAGGRLQHHPSRAGLTQPSKAGPVWTGEVRLNEGWLDQPLRWRRPRRIFVCAHGDLFHESVPDAAIDRVFAVMALAPHHTFQVLTKRAARMAAYFDSLRREAFDRRERVDVVPQRIDDAAADLTSTHGGALEESAWPLPNVWLGVSAEDQERADERIPQLMFTPAARRFVSLEPLLGPIDLTDLPALKVCEDDESEGWRFDALADGDDYWFRDGEYTEGGDGPSREALDWVIVGGESGAQARPMHPDWVRQIRDACGPAEVAFFFKQWGSFSEFESGSPTRQVEIDSDEAATILEFIGPRRCAWVHRDGRVWRQVEAIPDETAARLMVACGKQAAGRLLDGVTHDAMPEAARG